MKAQLISHKTTKYTKQCLVTTCDNEDNLSWVGLERQSKVNEVKILRA